jgi:hypothetical protein
MLTIRLFVEGPIGAGTSTVMRLLSTQISAGLERYPAPAGGSVEWLTYSGGSFEGEGVRLEIASAEGVPAEWIDFMRSRSDAIILVAASTPDGVETAQRHLRQLVERLQETVEVNTAAFALLAHQQDRSDAMSPSQVAPLLGFDGDAPVAGTSRTAGGVQYGIAITLRSVLQGFTAGFAPRPVRGPETLPELVDELTALPVHSGEIIERSFASAGIAA